MNLRVNYGNFHKKFSDELTVQQSKYGCCSDEIEDSRKKWKDQPAIAGAMTVQSGTERLSHLTSLLFHARNDQVMSPPQIIGCSQSFKE
jgi:hypothetical protein